VTENSQHTLKLGIISVGCLYAWADSLSVTMGKAYWSSHEFTGVVIVAICAGSEVRATRRRSRSASPGAKYREKNLAFARPWRAYLGASALSFPAFSLLLLAALASLRRNECKEFSGIWRGQDGHQPKSTASSIDAPTPMGHWRNCLGPAHCVRDQLRP